MAYVIYTARRSLAPFHAAASQYELPLKLTEATPSREVIKEAPRSLSGAVETLYFGAVTHWSVRVAATRLTYAANLLEFLQSTEDGQVFTFDPYGLTSGAPVNQLSVVRADEGHTSERMLMLGRGGQDDFFTYGFQVREV